MLQELRQLSSNVEDIQILSKIAEFLEVHGNMSREVADSTVMEIVDAGESSFDGLLKESLEARGLSYENLLLFLVGQSTDEQLLKTPLTNQKVEDLQDYI